MTIRFGRAACAGLLLCLLQSLPTDADAVVHSFAADNPGTITGTTRTLTWQVSEVTGSVRNAEISLDLTFAETADLRVRLVRGGNRFFDLAGGDGSGDSGHALSGRYQFNDRGIGTLTLAAATEPGTANLPRHFAYRASTRNGSRECLVSLDRIFNFDVANPNGTWQIEVDSTGAATGNIAAATLVLDTAPDLLFAHGSEGPDGAPACVRSALDIRPATVLASAPLAQSPLATVSEHGPFATGVFSWRFSAFEPAIGNFGPIAFGGAPTDQVAVGRYGGQAHSQIAVWRESTATLYVDTVEGVRDVVLPGDFNGTQSRAIPGDYDGDEITDVAVVFKVGTNPWIARVRLSRSGELRDFFIDPRVRIPPVQSAPFDNGRFGFAPGADIDGDGFDEFIILRNRPPPAAEQLQFIRLIPLMGLGGGFTGWGLPTDRLVQGRFRSTPGEPASGLTVVRRGGDVLLWFVFPNFTPVAFGFETDLPVSADFTGDGINDIAVWRPSTRRFYYLDSSNGDFIESNTFTAPELFGEFPLGFVQGVLGLPEL